jgi:hypothetical protein
VIGHRLFLGLLPALLALLLHAPIAANAPLSIFEPASVESFERGNPLPSAGDLITKKQRHAASIEEYFAIDDDADQHAKWPERAVALSTPFTLVGELQPFVYSGVAPSHPPCAAPPTGPPHA